MQRIAVSTDDKNGLESVVSPHFGRCPYYVLVDVEGREIRAVLEVENPYYGQHAPGQVPGFIHRQGANVMITGGMGGRAIGFFQQYGIEPVTGAYGTVRAALESYFDGGLQGATACRESREHGHGVQLSEKGEYEHDEAGRLREEAEMLRKQLEDVEARLKRLSGGC